MNKLLIILLLFMCFKCRAQPGKDTINWEYLRDSADVIVDSSGRSYWNYPYWDSVFTPTAYDDRYRAYDNKHKKYYKDCCILYLPNGSIHFMNGRNWIYDTKIMTIQPYIKVDDIRSKPIYLGDTLIDKRGKAHRVTYWNGAYRYGQATKTKPLDSIITNQQVKRDSLFIKPKK